MNHARYSYFGNQLVNLKPELYNVKAVGTDGERALYIAMSDTFLNAVRLRCFHRSYENILSKLRNLHISDNASEEIINDIFGKITSGEHQLDAEDNDDFDVKLESVKLRWNNLEKLHCRLLSDESFDPCFYI